MQGAIAKLSVVAGVVGIGLLTLLQVNRGIQDSPDNTATEIAKDAEIWSDESDDPGAASSADDTDANASAPQGQKEPTAATWDEELQAASDAGTTDDSADGTAGDPAAADELFGSGDTTGSTSLNSTDLNESEETADVDEAINNEDLLAGKEVITADSSSLDDSDDSTGISRVNGLAVDDKAPDFGDGSSTSGNDNSADLTTKELSTHEDSDSTEESSDEGPKMFPAPSSRMKSVELVRENEENPLADAPEPLRLEIDESTEAVPLKKKKSLPPDRLLTGRDRLSLSTDDEGSSELQSSTESAHDETDVKGESELNGDHENGPSAIAGEPGAKLTSPQPAIVDDADSPDFGDSAIDSAETKSTVTDSISIGEKKDISGAIDNDTASLPEQSNGDQLPELQTVPSRKSLSADDSSDDKKSAGETYATEDQELHGDATVDQDVPQGVLRPHLTIEKVAPKHAVLGQPMVYQILVKNQGEADAHQVVVEDRIPRGSQLSGTDPQAVLTDRKLVWDLGTLAAGEEKKISVRVVPTSEGSIGSVATVNFVAEISAETMITAPKLELELSGPKSVDLGRTAEMHFKLTNSGNSPAERVFIREVIPAGFEHPAGEDLEYEVGGLSPGQSREIDLKLKAVQPGRFINRAVATAEGGWEVESKFEIEINGPQLTITRNGPKRRTLGRSAVYSNTVFNEGASAVRKVTIEETVPEGMEFVEASDGGTYHSQEGLVVWKFDELQPAASLTVSVVLMPRERGTMASKVRAVDSRNIPVDVASTTEVIGHPSLSIDSTALEGPINVGEDVAFRVQIRNRGTAPATSLEVKMKIPPGLKFVTARGLTADNKTENQVHFVPVEQLLPDKNLEFELVFEASEAGDSRVQLEVRTDQMKRPLTREEAVVVFSDEK
ncbi:MAG: hypothetical protein ACKVT0_20545 [Planctomycetaceae bacterium]